MIKQEKKNVSRDYFFNKHPWHQNTQSVLVKISGNNILHLNGNFLAFYVGLSFEAKAYYKIGGNEKRLAYL